jgi:hypothetical protein
MLRAGWRLLLYLLMGLALVFAMGFVLGSMRHLGITAIWRGFISEATLVIAAFLPAIVMTKIEHRPFGDYGLSLQNTFGKFLWIGAAWGFCALTALLLVLRASHVFYFGGIALHGVRILKFALFYLLFFLLVSFFEEFLFRGYTLFTGSTSVGFWPSAIVLSLLFGSVHLGNSGESPIGALAAAAIGLFFCLTVRRTGDLWFAVGFHTSWNWGQSYLYSVPNSGTKMTGHLTSSSLQGPVWLSGGSVGPEGSFLCFVLIVLLWIAFNRVYPETRYPLTTVKLQLPVEDQSIIN